MEPVGPAGGTTLRLSRGWPEEPPPAWRELWGEATLAPTLAEIGAHIRAGGAEVWTIELRGHERPVAVIPVRREPRRVGGLALNALCLAGSDLYDYLPLAIAAGIPADDLSEALRLAARRLRADTLALDNLLPPCPPALARHARWFENRYFDAGHAGDGWRPLARKESLRRHAARARRELQYTTTHVTDGIPDPLLREIAQHHIERWRFDGIESPFLRPQRPGQYRAAGARALVTVLRHGEALVAAHIGLRAGEDTLLWHTPVINIRYLSFSPLEVLLLETVEECARRGLRVLDFGLGDEGYKERFGNAVRPVWNLFLPVTPRGRLAAVLRRLPGGRALRRRLGGWLARRRPAAPILARFIARERCFAVPSHAIPAPPAAPSLALREARDFGEFVDLMRAAGLPLRRPDYERYRRGLRFLALTDGPSLHAGAWCRSAGDVDEIADLRAQPGRPGALVQFLARLSTITAAARIVLAGRDAALLDACRTAGLTEIHCRRGRPSA